MVSIERYLAPYIKKDLNDKIILLTGPRQVVSVDNKPTHLIEVKILDTTLSPIFRSL